MLLNESHSEHLFICKSNPHQVLGLGPSIVQFNGECTRTRAMDKSSLPLICDTIGGVKLQSAA